MDSLDQALERQKYWLKSANHWQKIFYFWVALCAFNTYFQIYWLAIVNFLMALHVLGEIRWNLVLSLHYGRMK